MALRGPGRAGGSTRMAACTSTTAAAYYVCALGSYDDIKAALDGARGNSIAALLLAATAWQCEGDALRAEAVLRRAFDAASDDDRAYVVDMLVPLLVSRGVTQRAAALV